MTPLTDTRLYELALNTRDMLSFDRLVTLAYWLMQTAHVGGEVVEFGCYEGHTAAFMQALTTRQVYVYDSFRGLPVPTGPDAEREPKYQEGSMWATPQEVTHNFCAAGLAPPVICPKWFKDIQPDDLPWKISFAHLDCDFFESMTQALTLVYPRMSPGGCILVDDFSWTGLPGVKLAVSQFFLNKPERIVVPLGQDGEPARQCYVIKK